MLSGTATVGPLWGWYTPSYNCSDSLLDQAIAAREIQDPWWRSMPLHLCLPSLLAGANKCSRDSDFLGRVKPTNSLQPLCGAEQMLSL